MSVSGFYSWFQHIRYPIVDGTKLEFTGPAAVVLHNRVLVDAGFVLGPQIEAEPDSPVLLSEIQIGGGNVTFVFAVLGQEFQFVFSLADSGFPLVSRENAVGGESFGTGFVAVGDLSPLQTWADGTYTPVNDLRVEPANVQVDALVYRITPGNVLVDCPPECGEEPGAVTDKVTLGTPLTNTYIELKDGYNSVVSLQTTAKILSVDAQVGGGEGEPCAVDGLLVNGEDSDTFQCEKCNEGISSLNGAQVAGRRAILVGRRGISIYDDGSGGIIVDARDYAGCEV